MTVVVLQSSKVPASNPFHLTSQLVNANTPHASSSRSQQPSELSDVSTSNTTSSPALSSRAFGRIRASLEQSLRSATRSKKVPPSPADEFATITARNSKAKTKEKVVVVEPPRKEKERSGMLRRLESKVTFRRAGRETPSPLPPLPLAKDPVDKVRAAGFTSFITPSMRQGSMSSPSLHLSSQALPSPKSRPAIPASSSSNSEALATPTRDRTRRQSLQPPKRDISSPTPLGGRREPQGIGHINPSGKHTPVSRHRSTKSVPLALPSLPSTPTTPNARSDGSGSSDQSPETPTPTRRAHDIPSPPSTPTPMSSPSHQLGRISSRKGAASSGHLPLNTPRSPRASSPIHPRPTRIVTPRGLASSSASHLPLTPSSPSPTPRRPSIDSPRRPSVEMSRRVSGETARRPSLESARLPSLDNPRPSHDYPARGGESPTPRPRAVSPNQRSYAQNRHFNISTTSLSGPPNPEYRELIRTATSMMCKEIVKIPPHMNRTESGVKDWEEVEVRTRALARAERIWGKSGIAGGSSSNLNLPSGSGISANAEERERRLFGDALRDGYVLCQLMNKLRSASIVKPDARADGVLQMSNITKFLAACSSYGLPEEDLFQRDDLIEATGGSLARVAHTIIALVKFVDTPVVHKSKYLSGQGKKPAPISIPGPYIQGGPSYRASTSTPNLIQPSTSPTPTSPIRKRYSPPSGLPTVRSDSPDLTLKGAPPTKRVDDTNKVDILETKDHVPHIMTPPPRSPLRTRPKRNDDTELATWAKTAASPPRPLVSDSMRVEDVSIRESYNARQSIMTETTATTDISSILDFGHYSGNNKFGTIRTITTDATSEAPSMTRTEGSAIADELARKKSVDSGMKHHRDRKLSEAPLVDLSRVVEEGDESASSSSKDRGRVKATGQTKAVPKPEKAPALHLRKGKWPDDFMDAFQAHSPTRAISPKSPSPDEEDAQKSSTPVSISPPRKLAIVGATRRSDSLEAIPQFPRRPTHRARQSVDAPILMPKESMLGRDSSPDGLTSGPSGRIMLRRHSSKPGGPQRNGVYLAPPNEELHDSDSDSRVPFPRTAGEYGGTPSPVSGPSSLDERPRIHRGRFQSDINDSSARHRPRPNSHDELGANPMRSRYESMVNLGAASASASDLLSRDRDSLDGSAVRKTLILREEGKPPTHFQLGNCIGRGQFGSVYRALNLNTGQMVAVKRIRLEGLKEEEVTTLMREVDLVKRLSHPSIVKYEGMARDTDTLSIVLEYAENGSLGQTLKAFGKLNERLVAGYVVKILEGLHYLHQSDVVHCDLKAANILTTKNGNVKLSDFGVSLNLRAVEREKDVAGTPNWMAPEVIELKGASTKSDIWSLACTVIELLTGRPPYAEIANSMSVMFRIVDEDMPPLPDSCSPFLQDFLTQCFHKDPKKRPSAEMLFEHPWLKQNWGIHKELRPQDSIPFLRRVSADLQKSEFARYFQQIEMPEPPTAATSAHIDERDNTSPLGRRTSEVPIRPLADNDISPREHSFVKTTFSKPMVCRVCLLNVKKSAVLCAQCSLIAHSKCAVNAPPTCDLRAQLLLYAKYAEKGNPASIYSNPAEGLRGSATSPASDVPYVAHSPRTSIDMPTPSPQTLIPPHPVSPPTAYKFMGAFKRSRSNLSPEPNPPVASSSTQSTSKPREDKVLRKKAHVTTKPAKDRPHSLTSNSTDLNSVRSAATAAESFSSRHDKRSVVSSVATRKSAGGLSENSETVMSSRMTARSEAATDHDITSNSGHIPGSLPMESWRPKKREKSPGCTLQ